MLNYCSISTKQIRWPLTGNKNYFKIRKKLRLFYIHFIQYHRFHEFMTMHVDIDPRESASRNLKIDSMGVLKLCSIIQNAVTKQASTNWLRIQNDQMPHTFTCTQHDMHCFGFVFSVEMSATHWIYPNKHFVENGTSLNTCQKNTYARFDGEKKSVFTMCLLGT